MGGAGDLTLDGIAGKEEANRSEIDFEIRISTDTFGSLTCLQLCIHC